MSNSKIVFLLFHIIIFVIGINLFGQAKVVVAGSDGTGTSGTMNGTYTYYGDSNSRPAYSFGNYRLLYSNYAGMGLEWEIYDTGSSQNKYYNSSTSSTVPTSGWATDVVNGSTAPTISSTTIFTDGSSYVPPNGIPNTNNNPIGRFLLTASTTNAALTSVAVNLSGSPANVTNVKLWSSTDNSFNALADNQLKSVSFSSSVTFSSISSSISTSGTYYFLTVDLSSSASGSVTATISNENSFSFTGNSMNGTFTSALLSSATVPLPVELTSFTAQQSGNMVTLNWATATEVKNYGFQVERKKEKVESEWEEIGFLQGNGNSNSPKSYSFVDKTVSAGRYSYRLKQIDFDGQFEYSPVVDVQVDVPSVFALKQNYPNPFNPNTIIGYQLPSASHVALKIYDILGNEVAVLVNGLQAAGDYELLFNGEKLNSGIYFYKLQTSDGFTATKKLMLVK